MSYTSLRESFVGRAMGQMDCLKNGVYKPKQYIEEMKKLCAEMDEAMKEDREHEQVQQKAIADKALEILSGVGNG